MHDTFLFERLYETIIKLCTEKDIDYITQISIEVNKDSHVSDKGLLDLFLTRKCDIIDEDTEIIIEKTDFEKLNALIKSIEGLQYDE